MTRESLGGRKKGGWVGGRSSAAARQAFALSGVAGSGFEIPAILLRTISLQTFGVVWNPFDDSAILTYGLKNIKVGDPLAAFLALTNARCLDSGDFACV